MLNPKISASNKLKKKHSNPRSPLKLKNLNVSSSSSSSLSCSSSSFSSSTTANSISSEAPKGCLKFFLSNNSSNFSKNYSNTKFNCSLVNKTPKSAPNFRNFRGNLVKKHSNLPNPENFTHRIVKKNPNAPYVRKLEKKFSKNSSDIHVESCKKVRKISSKYDFSDGISKKSSRVEVNSSKNAVNLRKPGSKYEFSDERGNFFTRVDVNLSENIGDFTPVNRFECGSNLVSVNMKKKCVNLVENDENCGGVVSRSPTPPPVQASVSPEIQGGGSTSVAGVAATPMTCYAAGHVLSGVTDKRKCRPKGILTIGNSRLFESSKTEGFRDGVNSRRDSIVPSLTEASVCWLSSPCDGKRDEAKEDDDDSDDDVMDELRLSSCEELLPFNLVGCSSSLSSSLGFSSEMFDKSNSTSDASSTRSCRSKSSLLHSDMSSEYRGVLGPSLDHLVRCPSPPSSPLATPTFNLELSPKQDTFRRDHEREAAPDFEDSLGSRNVMQTPESNSSPSNFELFHHSPNPDSKSPNFDLSELNKNQISRLKFEWELDSVAEILHNCQISELNSPRPSFKFNPIVKLNNSTDLTSPQNDIDTETRDSLPEPEFRISCRDDLDCCRYLSDEEDTANGRTVGSAPRSRT